MLKTLYTTFLLLMPFLLASQISNLHSRNMVISTSPQLIDSLTVVTNSITIIDPSSGEPLRPHLYSVANNRIKFAQEYVSSLVGSQLVTIHYRVLPFDLSAPVFRIDSTRLIREPGDRIIGFKYDPYATQPQPLFPQQGLDYNGTFSRGLSFGNNQSLVLNSQFNLQMAGSLGDLDILAAISDNNIPIQPEGNTQQLREFDRVFIQISKDNNQLIAGDYELGRPNGYFMNYFKKLQGATYSGQWAPYRVTKGSEQAAEAESEVVLKTTGSVAIAKGKFARNVIQPQEGNQGPYRLQGAEGERFIIILAGTEKVYVDGHLMNRGLEYDYVIDYNAGHISFTSRRLVTKDSRIIVEFDYADQNFQRSLLALNTELRGNNYKLYLNTYSEQDSKRPVDDEFSEEELEALQKAGDSNLSAIVNSVNKVDEFSAFRVLYRSADTLVNGTLHRGVLVFSSNRETAKYSATFSDVGFGNGNYVLDAQTSANGRVYRWLAPDPATGLPRGDHEPVRRLVAPKSQQLFTAGGQYDLSENTFVRAEVALSNTDANRLSPIDEGDNTGMAVTAGVSHLIELSRSQNEMVKGRNARWLLETNADYEYVQQHFRELNPYRTAEFTRDWNLSTKINDIGIFQRESGEHLLSAGFTLKTPSSGNLNYRFGGFFRDSLYTGTKNLVNYIFQNNGYDVRFTGDLLNTQGVNGESKFFRPRFHLGIPIFRDSSGLKFWKTGLAGEREANRRLLGAADTLHYSSFHYDILRVFLESPESGNFNIRSYAQRRYDYSPVLGDFSQSTTADEISIQGNWRQSRNSHLGWNFTYRQLNINDPSLSNLEPGSTYMGRLDYTFNIRKGFIQSGTSYEIGSGQERKVEFTYLEVPAGDGTHQWQDRNGDGVVQFDEIEIAAFQDLANAVRVTVFTDDFIRTNNVTLNQSLRFEPRAIWFNETGIKNFLSRFSTQSTLLINRKVRPGDAVSAWNPFQLDVADTALVSTRASTYNTLFFNRANPKFDVQLGLSDNQNKFVLTTGFESRRQEEQFIKARWNLTRVLGLHVSMTTGYDEQGSELFESKRYKIRFFESKPQFTFQPSNNFRVSMSWRYKNAENQLGTTGENAKTHDLKMETVYNQSATTSIRSEMSFVKIKFEGKLNSPVGFAFLQGLQNGRNLLWNISIDRQVAKNIRLGISYEGRKSGTANIVHVGRAQMAAVF